jgi:hypothetical protein
MESSSSSSSSSSLDKSWEIPVPVKKMKSWKLRQKGKVITE